MLPSNSAFEQNSVLIYFLYGLTFFSMGLILPLLSRRTSQLKLTRAIVPLAAFGLLHGIHEWIEMFQIMAALFGDTLPSTIQEIIRLIILAASFLLLFAFGVLLLTSKNTATWKKYLPFAAIIAIWFVAIAAVAVFLQPSPNNLPPIIDVLTRYLLGVTAAIVGAWALMVQQRTLREQHTPQLGRSLVWSAVALLLYGLVGQTITNGEVFLNWFGVPIQLVRSGLIIAFAIFLIKALRAIEFESERRHEVKNEAEQAVTVEMEHLNVELRLTAHKLALLLDFSNLLVEPMEVQDRLQQVLNKIVRNLEFSNAGLILLIHRETEAPYVAVLSGLIETDTRYAAVQDLGNQCISRGLAMCRHLDGQVIEFLPENALQTERCRQYVSPVSMISFPLTAQNRIIGSIVLASPENYTQGLTIDEFSVMVGIGQQLGLSIENARLNRDLWRREKMLAELLHQAVGAQEAERQRIARELHDATSQSLTAISLGLRGIETMVTNGATVDVSQIRELQAFGTSALGDLRRIIADLRPSQLDDLGLVAALRWYLQAFEQRRAIHTHFLVDGKKKRLPSEYETVLFRIVQEALTNVAKHANATDTTVILGIYADHACLTIEDNGDGFNPETVFRNEKQQSGWGLLGIQERSALLGGSYNIDSSPQHGTRIYVNVPLMVKT